MLRIHRSIATSPCVSVFPCIALIAAVKLSKRLKVCYTVNLQIVIHYYFYIVSLAQTENLYIQTSQRNRDMLDI
jgi:hypothetical protein